MVNQDGTNNDGNISDPSRRGNRLLCNINQRQEQDRRKELAKNHQRLRQHSRKLGGMVMYQSILDKKYPKCPNGCGRMWLTPGGNPYCPMCKTKGAKTQ